MPSTTSLVQPMDDVSKVSMIPKALKAQLERDELDLFENGVICWTATSPLHPRKWTLKRKIYDTAVIVFLEFVTTMISNTGSASARDSHKALGISYLWAVFAFTSTYLIGQAFGSILFPPLTECFGRKRTYVCATLLYAMFCLVAALPNHIAGVVIGRLFSGFLSAIPSVVVGGSIEDMWSPRARIWAIQAWVAVSIIGLSIAPIVATVISSAVGWQWTYYMAAILTFIIGAMAFFIRESRPNYILHLYVQKLGKKYTYNNLSIEHLDHAPTFQEFSRLMIARPIGLFFTEPIIFLVTIMCGSVYALLYLFTEGIDFIYTAGFGFSNTSSALVFLAISVGILPSLLVRMFDSFIAGKRKKQGKSLLPEDKLLGFLIAAPINAIGLWWFAWSIPPRVGNVSPWISIVALIPLGFATNEFDQVLTGYLCDTYSTIAGSANAPLSFLRAFLSAVYPLFATAMFTKLGNNIAVSILAGLATLYCGVAWAFWKHGKAIREASPWVKANAVALQGPEKVEEEDLAV